MQYNIQSICIVGTGFRGLGVLERIVAYARKYKGGKTLRVYLVDHASEGPEQYDTRQPDYLLLNIVCGQASIFPDVVSVPGCPPMAGPSLYEWSNERGLLLGDDGFTVGYNGRKIEPGDFLPRRLLGEYLKWFLELIKSQSKSYLDIVEYKAKAIDLKSDKNRLIVELSDGVSIEADYLFLTVGQIPEPNVSNLRINSEKYIDQPYPLPDQLKSINPGDTIAISGLGLTAIDAILALTIGRGGKIKTLSGVDSYIPSGKEPRIVAFSTSGLPYRSRPALGAPLKYNPIVFTRPAIDMLRAKQIKLDFDRDILPLIFTEMRIAYRRAQFGRDFGWDKAENLLEDLRRIFVEGHLESHLSRLDMYDSFVFDPKVTYFESLTKPNSQISNVLVDSFAYESWFRSWLENDLKEARLGTNSSPLKAALEICREFRDLIRYAVEFDSLTDESSDRFYSFHAGTLNRIGVGPQKERTANILALIRSGVLNISLGPNPKVTWDDTINKWKLSSSKLQVQHDEFVDYIYRGSISYLHSLKTDTSIVGAMARRGFLRRYRPESLVNRAVDIDRHFHPISQNGKANERIWIMGLLCEGVTFYNGYVTSPERFIRSQYDADNAVAKIFSEISHIL